MDLDCFALVVDFADEDVDERDIECLFIEPHKLEVWSRGVFDDVDKRADFFSFVINAFVAKDFAIMLFDFYEVEAIAHDFFGFFGSGDLFET